MLKGHISDIFSLTFSSDGKIIATASYDNKIHHWDTKTGDRLTCLKGHLSSVMVIRYSTHDVLASAGGDRSIILWSPVSKSFFHHQQMIDVYSDSQAFNCEKVLFNGAKLSPMNQRLLEQNQEPSDEMKYTVWQEPRSKRPIFPMTSFPDELFPGFGSDFKAEIVHRFILQRLELKEWQLLACLNQSANMYFGRLKNLIETLVEQAIPISTTTAHNGIVAIMAVVCVWS